MGNRQYSSSTFSASVNNRFADANGNTRRTEEIFTQKLIHKSLDPKYVTIRESVDSDKNPTSTPIIIATDVTGSMGHYAGDIAHKQLGKVFSSLINSKVIEYPHMMFMAVGDVYSDNAPLQVSQFEPDEAILEQLQLTYIEGNGGGNNTESYNLPWWFAVNKCKLDSFDNRQSKGYLFTLGDEHFPNDLSSSDLKKVFGSGDHSGISNEQLLEQVKQKFNVFHLIIMQSSFYQRHTETVLKSWRDKLDNSAILVDNTDNLSDIITAVIRVSEGEDPHDVLNSFSEKSDIHYSVNLALFG